MTTVQTTEILSCVFLGWAVGGPLQGLIADKFGNIYLQMFFGSIIAAILLAVSIFVPMGLIELRICLFLTGFFSSVQIMIFTVARINIQERFLGMGIAFINALTMLGGMFMPSLVGYLLVLGWDHSYSNGVPVYSVQNYQHALIALPFIVGFAGICALILKIRNNSSSDSDLKVSMATH